MPTRPARTDSAGDSTKSDPWKVTNCLSSILFRPPCPLLSSPLPSSPHLLIIVLQLRIWLDLICMCPLPALIPTPSNPPLPFPSLLLSSSLLYLFSSLFRLSFFSLCLSSSLFQIRQDLSCDVPISLECDDLSPP